MTIPLINSTEGMDSIATNIIQQIPFFFPGMLFFLWLIIVMVGYLYQEKKTGEGNIKAWLAVGSFIIASIAIILYLMAGLIDGITVTVAIGLTIVFVLIYLTS